MRCFLPAVAVRFSTVFIGEVLGGDDVAIALLPFFPLLTPCELRANYVQLPTLSMPRCVVWLRKVGGKVRQRTQRRTAMRDRVRRSVPNIAR